VSVFVTGREGLDILCHRSSFFARLSGRLFGAYLSVTDHNEQRGGRSYGRKHNKTLELRRLWQACAGIGVGVPSFISSLLKKQADGELSISEIMVKAHRSKVMQKKKADSLASDDGSETPAGNDTKKLTRSTGKSVQLEHRQPSP
jgi:hypothetical protein